MILKLSQWKQNLLFRRWNVQKKILVVEKKYVWSFLLYLWVKATDHEILWPQPGKCFPWSYGKFCIFQWGSVRCRLPTDCRLLFLGLENNGTIVFMFSFEWWKKKKSAVCGILHWPIFQSGSGKYVTYMSPIHTAIPCHSSCSGQGTCLKDGQCLCWWGWTGPNAKYIVSGSLKNRILVRAEWPP